jgi:hypothetical protein
MRVTPRMKLAPLPTHLAAVKRSVYLALALCGRDDAGTTSVLAVRLQRLSPSSQLTRDFLRSFAADYGVRCAVVEEGSELVAAAQAAGLRVVPLTMAQAKQCLTGSPAADRQRFFMAVLAREPCLKRLVTFLRGTTKIELTDRWKITKLLAVALGLTYADALQPTSPPTSFTP